MDGIEREHFAFLKSYWEQIKLLPSKKQKCEVFEAILSVQFFEKEINSISFSNQNQMILWEGLKPILKQSQKGYLDKMGLKGLNPKQGSSQAPIQHKDKEEEEDKELERERERGNIFFQLRDNEQLREIDNYISHLIEEDFSIKNERSFGLKIKKQLANKDKFQLEDFEKWYLLKECEVLEEKFKGKYFKGNIISQIYPYCKTDSFNPDNKFIIWFNEETASSFTKCFQYKSELNKILNEASDAII